MQQESKISGARIKTCNLKLKYAIGYNVVYSLEAVGKIEA